MNNLAKKCFFPATVFFLLFSDDKISINNFVITVCRSNETPEKSKNGFGVIKWFQLEVKGKFRKLCFHLPGRATNAKKTRIWALVSLYNVSKTEHNLAFLDQVLSKNCKTQTKNEVSSVWMKVEQLQLNWVPVYDVIVDSSE